MSSLGINVPLTGEVSPDQIAALGASWVRVVAHPEYDLSAYFEALRARGIRVLLVLARESGGDYAHHARRYDGLVTAVAVGNEPDADPSSVSSWIMSPYEWVALGRAVRALFTRSTVVAGGLVSGQPGWLAGLDLRWASALCVHPYGKSPDRRWPHPGWGTGYLGDLLDGYAEYGLPLLVSEIGLSAGEVGEDFQAEYLTRLGDYFSTRDDVPAWMWFCLSDTMVPEFGLFRVDGSEKPSYWAFKRAAETVRDFTWPTLPTQPPAPPTSRATELLDRIEADLRELRALVG